MPSLRAVVSRNRELIKMAVKGAALASYTDETSFLGGADLSQVVKRVHWN